jgi:hypothetical protein
MQEDGRRGGVVMERNPKKEEKLGRTGSTPNKRFRFTECWNTESVIVVLTSRLVRRILKCLWVSNYYLHPP